jgi:type IV secretory pathway VirB10-like protein
MSAAPDTGPEEGMPRVAIPQRPLTLWVGAGVIAALGAIVFTTLVANQQRPGEAGALAPPVEAVPGRADAAGAVPEPPPAPMLFAPPPAPAPAPVEAPPPLPPPPPPPPTVIYSPPLPPPPVETEAPPGPQAQDLASRRRSPSLVVDLTTPPVETTPEAAAAAAAAASANDAFSGRLAAAEPPPARATQIANPSTLIPQGVMIAAVLETAINSDLPGFVRAVVSRDVSSFDGSAVLIPRGSRLVGQYRSEMALGQRRAFVVWTRLIRPDGATIQIGSPGADPLGRAGLEGRVNRHLLERFGPGVLTTALNAALTNNGGANTQLIIGSGTQAIPAAVGAADGAAIKPTVMVRQGSAIQVFVARDLDFSTAPPLPAARPAAQGAPAEAGPDAGAARP